MTPSELIWKAFCRIARAKTVRHVYGKIPDGGPYIYAINHPTSFDPCQLCDILGWPKILMTEFVFGLPIAGKIVEGNKFISVPYHNSKDVSKSRAAFCGAMNSLLMGDSIMIAPNGKLDQDGLKPKTGAVRLSRKTGAPIVPVSIKYKGKIYTHYIKNNGKSQIVKWCPSGEVCINIQKPMRGIAGSDRDASDHLGWMIMRCATLMDDLISAQS